MVPKGSNVGSERVKLWFRKGQTKKHLSGFLIGQTLVLDLTNPVWFLMGQIWGS